MLDYAVSSYIPTVSFFAQSRQHKHLAAESQRTQGIGVITQPESAGLVPIPGVAREAIEIEKAATAVDIPFELLDGSHATVEATTNMILKRSIIHFACHATQDSLKPLDSGVYLHDTRMTLSTIIQRTASHLTRDAPMDLAFLSACQTCTGDQGELADEAAHLAAGMLAAGYRAVVATMWSIRDDLAPEVAKDFYEYLLEGAYSSAKPRGDKSGASYALAHAVRRLAERLDSSDASLLAWVPYVHFGL